jgi:subtilase family serine protease
MISNPRRRTFSVALAALLVAASLPALSDGLKVADLGLAASDQKATVSLVLRLRDQQALETYAEQAVTPGSANFQQFLSTAEFARRYGASDAQIQQVQSFLASNGLQGQVLDNHMVISVSGTLGQFGRMFGTPIHTYVAQDGRRFHRPVSPLVMPTGLGTNVLAASGLSDERKFLPHHITVPTAVNFKAQGPSAALRTQSAMANDGNPTATGIPGQYTVGDVADFYNINPLYQRGLTGAGSTVAIVTLADFDPTDAENYWDGIGLPVKPKRITQVHVDGGGGDEGSDETTLDVEQAGGLAPEADIIVYDAPNAGSGFIDAFARAVSDNIADSISTSWGMPEIFNFAALNGGNSYDTTDVGDLQAYHQIFLEAAVQGQSLFAASGDSGAYDTVRGLGAGDGPYTFNAPLTVDSPASDPNITAAGGTTVPVSFINRDGDVVLSIDQESVWGWDYLLPLVGSRDYVFSVGGGGGVSVYWRAPKYQMFFPGVRKSEINQTLTYNDPDSGPYTYITMPARFTGRNVPDVALNADPETGYLFYWQGGFYSSGGTSFVAPQLNGISALLKQSTHHRIGLWNSRLYRLQKTFGYGRNSAFTSVTAGDNWFYHGESRYNPGAGLGTLNVANFDQLLRSGY